MNLTKRLYYRASALGIGVALLTTACDGLLSGAYAYNYSPPIPLFATALRGAGPGGIPVALPGPLPAPVTGVTHYQIGIIQFQDQITPTSSGLGPTTLWGYAPLRGLGGYIKPTHLSGIIIGKGKNPNDPLDKNVPIQITFHNKLLVNKHILPVDTTIQGANQAINRTAVHLHGGLVPWISDGGPFDWFGPFNDHGSSFLNNKTLNPIHLPGAAEYYYPLNQSARFMWYHDHAVGITRLNAYAGIASGMLIRDGFEKSLVDTKGLPGYIEAGGNEIPLVFQDKTFVGTDIDAQDPQWRSMVQKAATRPGSLWYAHTYEIAQPDGTGRWDLEPGGLPLQDPSIIPEFFGDTMLVNGTTFPEASVQARRYRLRMLNACNARFLNLQLYYDDGSPDGITLNKSGRPTNDPFVNAATGTTTWLQIGTEGGFLAKPVQVASNVSYNPLPGFSNGDLSLDPSLIEKSLVVAPAERPDLIVDFAQAAGRNVILYNDAAAPFPNGDDRNDYFPGLNTLGQALLDGGNAPAGNFGIGNPVNGKTKPGHGPNTRVLMRFKVAAATTGPADNPLDINVDTNLTGGIDPSLHPWGSTTDIPATIKKRILSLNEYYDDYGRLIQILGNETNIFGTPYDGSANYLTYPGSATVGATTENVTEGDTEIWEIHNTSADVHPMHFHLVNVQVLNRQLIDPMAPPPTVGYGALILPDPNELGWKETVPMYPGTVTRVIMKWDLASASIVGKNLKPVNTKAIGNIRLPITMGQPPVSPRTGFMEYVWHCHILEHEEHDMMHALIVTPKKPSPVPPLL